jgi:hypothetical protein
LRISVPDLPIIPNLITTSINPEDISYGITHNGFAEFFLDA